MQAVAGLMVPTLLAGAVLRSPTIYHPRRKVILHLKTLNKTKKQRQDFENKPPYFDFSPLGMRSVQVLLISTFVTNMGAHVPFLLLVSCQYPITATTWGLRWLGVGEYCNH